MRNISLVIKQAASRYIDDDLWMGKPISAKTPVTIIGEIDIDYKPAKRVEVDVNEVKF